MGTINLRRIFEDNGRVYAQKEEELINHYLDMNERLSKYPYIETSETAFCRAYVLAHADIAEGTLSDTRKELAALGVRDADSLFELQLETLKITREQVCDGYVYNPVTSQVMISNLKAVWTDANSEIQELYKKLS